MYVFLSILIGFLLFIYFYLTRNNNYWESKGVPSVKPKFLYGNLKDRIYKKISFHEFHKEFYFKFKGSPFYGVYDGSSPSLQLIDPDLIKNILIKDFDCFQDRPHLNFKQITPYVEKMLISLQGKEWKEVRSVLTPAFSSGKLKAMVEIEKKCGDQINNYISEKIKESGGLNAELDMKETLGKYTMDVIAATAFGVELDSNSHPDSEFAQRIAKFNETKGYMRYLFFLIIIFGLPEIITSRIPLSFLNVETVEFLANLLKDTTSKRKENGMRRNDFLQLLIDAQTGPLSDDNALNKETNNEKGPVLSEVVALSQAIIFFIAGYETSGTLLTMICYELSKNKDIQDKLRTDIIEKLKEHNGEVSYDMINDLPYLDMVISETLRLYPPVARLERVCLKKYKLAHLDLKPGDRVHIPIYGIHMDPDYYPKPEEFKPERFSSEQKTKRHPCVYLPFGAGPRNCIGLRFALLSTKICVIYMLKEFNINKSEKTKIPFEFDRKSFLLKPNGSVIVSLSKL